MTYIKSTYLQAWEELGDEIKKDFCPENTITYKEETITVDKWRSMHTSNEIATLSPEMQRVLLEDVWSAKDYRKSQEYLRTVFIGLGKMTPFIVVSITFIRKSILEQIDDTDNKNIIKGLKILLKKVDDMIEKGAKYINIDGQSRTKMGILSFLENKFDLKAQNMGGFRLYNEGMGGHEDITINTKFEDLTNYQKGFILSRELKVVYLSGSLHDISDVLYGINQNEKWTEWQSLYCKPMPSEFRAIIAMLFNNAKIKDFLLKYIEQRTYKPEYSDMERLIAETLAWLTHHTTIDNPLLAKLLDMEKESPNKSTKEKFRKNLNDWIDNYNGKKINPIYLFTYFAYMDVMERGNKNKKINALNTLTNVHQFKILNPGKFINWFLQQCIRMQDTNNREDLDSHWYENHNPNTNKSDTKAVTGGWPDAMSRGLAVDGTVTRIRWINKCVVNSKKQLESDGIIAPCLKSMPKINSLFVANDYKDSDGDEIDLTKPNNHHRGHDTSKANGGTNDIDNLYPQKKQSNLDYNTTNLITNRERVNNEKIKMV